MVLVRLGVIFRYHEICKESALERIKELCEDEVND